MRWLWELLLFMVLFDSFEHSTALINLKQFYYYFYHSENKGTDEDELLWNVCHEEVIYPRYLSENVKNVIFWVRLLLLNLLF